MAKVQQKTWKTWNLDWFLGVGSYAKNIWAGAIWNNNVFNKEKSQNASFVEPVSIANCDMKMQKCRE